MLAHLRAIGVLLLATLLLCSVAYPLMLLALAQGLFPGSANGSLIEHDGRTVGSRLIAQPCKGDEWFRPRPSAVDHNAAAAGGSNLAASNPALRKRVREQLAELPQRKEIPADAVTASGSGLDPHISLANARMQSERVARAWAAKSGKDLAEVNATVDQVLEQNAARPLGGVAGEVPLVNVLEVNLELSRRWAR
jgi:K+-transporting ATPase ATPase C chain